MGAQPQIHPSTAIPVVEKLWVGMRNWCFPSSVFPALRVGMQSVGKLWDTAVTPTRGQGTQLGCEQLPCLSWGRTSAVTLRRNDGANLRQGPERCHCQSPSPQRLQSLTWALLKEHLGSCLIRSCSRHYQGIYGLLSPQGSAAGGDKLRALGLEPQQDFLWSSGVRDCPQQLFAVLGCNTVK